VLTLSDGKLDGFIDCIDIGCEEIINDGLKDWADVGNKLGSCIGI